MQHMELTLCFTLSIFDSILNCFFYLIASGILHLPPPADSDPGLLPGRGHQLRADLGHLTLQLLELQPAHQGAEQDGGHSIGKPGGQKEGEGEDLIDFEK